MLRLARFQDGAEIESPVGHVLTHAEEDAVQVVAQLDWLRGKEKCRNHHNCATSLMLVLNITALESLPDFEVVENQQPSRESYPANRPASSQQK